MEDCVISRHGAAANTVAVPRIRRSRSVTALEITLMPV
jgi:hypothetical protein